MIEMILGYIQKNTNLRFKPFYIFKPKMNGSLTIKSIAEFKEKIEI